jgi:hypothetical protein
MVEQVFDRLEQAGILNNTYVFYSSDNGYHIGQHRLQPGKKCGYEEDINVPLIVRGPGVPEGATVDIPTSHVDLAPTFLDILGIVARDDFDGSPIPLSAEGIARSLSSTTESREHVQVEFWNDNDPNEWNSFSRKLTIRNNSCLQRKVQVPDRSIAHGGINNTYKALRLIGDTYNLYYSVWCTNEHELYDMAVSKS